MHTQLLELRGELRGEHHLFCSSRYLTDFYINLTPRRKTLQQTYSTAKMFLLSLEIKVSNIINKIGISSFGEWKIITIVP